MDERTDSELLREYAETRSESAFGAVLTRHIDFVYSVALRITVDPHLAEDVTQKVFVALAASASRLSGRLIVSGWLHRTTRNLAAKTVRGEVRRRLREQEAAEMQTPEHDPIWKKMAPVLDSAIARLNDADRDVVLLRFFEKKTAAQIGAQMRLSEDAAQKRVNRAVEKLRLQLAREGVCLSATAILALLATQAVSAAPAPLVVATSAAALAAVPIKSGIGAACLEIISMTKIKIAATGAVVLACIVVPLKIHHAMLKRAWDENLALRNQLALVTGLWEQTQSLSNQLARMQEGQALTKAQMAELLRLRSEVGLLRRESQELAKLRAEGQKTVEAPTPFLPADAWANVGAEDPNSALQTFFWAGKHRATNLVADLIRIQRDPDIPESDELDEMFAKGLIAASSWFTGSLEAFRVVTTDKTGDNMTRLTVDLLDKKGKTTTHDLHFVQEQNQWFPVVHIWLQDKDNIRAAMELPGKFRRQ